MRMSLLCGVAAVAFAGAASANTVSHSFFTGQLQQTAGLTGFATSGDQMDGMTIRAVFADGFVQTLSWADTGAGAGGVFGAGWSLVQSGDTFSSPWTLVNSRNSALRTLLLDSAPNTVFDTFTAGDLEGTAGSARGTDLSIAGGGPGLDLRVRYSDAVALLNQSPVGDLYRRMEISFQGGFFGTMAYRQDADNTRLSDLTPTIPLPSAAGLGFAGLLAVGAGRRRR